MGVNWTIFRIHRKELFAHNMNASHWCNSYSEKSFHIYAITKPCYSFTSSHSYSQWNLSINDVVDEFSQTFFLFSLVWRILFVCLFSFLFFGKCMRIFCLSLNKIGFALKRIRWYIHVVFAMAPNEHTRIPVKSALALFVRYHEWFCLLFCKSWRKRQPRMPIETDWMWPPLVRIPSLQQFDANSKLSSRLEEHLIDIRVIRWYE